MQNCFSFPLRACLECLQGPSFTATQSYAHMRDERNEVHLDVNHMGPNTVLLKNGTRICGCGGALATVPIMQNKAFFEVEVKQEGVWGIGLATAKAELGHIPITKDAWFLRQDGCLIADGKEMGKLDGTNQLIREGDIVGVAFDHVELKFYKDEAPLPLHITTLHNIKGKKVYPMLYVDDNAILDVKFTSFSLTVPDGYEEIMVEQTLL